MSDYLDTSPDPRRADVAEMFATISHELNTPLTIISVGVQLMQETLRHRDLGTGGCEGEYGVERLRIILASMDSQSERMRATVARFLEEYRASSLSIPETTRVKVSDVGY